MLREWSIVKFVSLRVLHLRTWWLSAWRYSFRNFRSWNFSVLREHPHVSVVVVIFYWRLSAISTKRRGRSFKHSALEIIHEHVQVSVNMYEHVWLRMAGRTRFLVLGILLFSRFFSYSGDWLRSPCQQYFRNQPWSLQRDARASRNRILPLQRGVKIGPWIIRPEMNLLDEHLFDIFAS